MKKLYIFIFVGLCFCMHGLAMNDGDTTKTKSTIFRNDHYLDISIALGENVVVNSLQWDKLFPIANKRIRIGFGVRMNMANYWNKSFYTAPPQRVNNSFDTLNIEHQAIYYCNLQFVFDIALLKWWDAGMNIDLVGASWGPKADGAYFSHSTGDVGSTQGLKPETLNLMLFGNNDHGNLNSQFYLRFWPSSNVFVKAGMSLNTFIMQTDNGLNNGNNRFNSGSYAGFLSLGWSPGRTELKGIAGRKNTITPSF